MKPTDTAAGGRRMVDGWPVADEPLPADPMLRLAYYARLAPSSHNSQPWKFLVGRGEIDLLVDETRWLRVADHDRRELFVSLGCALESMRIAADYAGFGSRVEYFPVAGSDTLVARLQIEFAGPKREFAAASLLEHAVTRRTSHKPFDPALAVGEDARKSLYACYDEAGVSLHYLAEDRRAMQWLAELEREADRALFADPAYREELAAWIGEGLLGTPWLISKIAQFAVGHLPVAERVAQDDADRVSSAPLVAVLSTRNDDPEDRVRAGAAYMRIALMAESRGLRVQPVSQALEVEATRTGVARLFDLRERCVQHLFRIGHAEAERGPHRRRPLKDLVIRETGPAIGTGNG